MPDDLLLWFAVFARAGALFAVFPLFSANNLPVPIRIALAAILAFLIVPSLTFPEVFRGLPPGVWGVIALLGREVALGLVMGFVARLIYFAIDFAAALISTEMGLSLPSGVNPLSPGQSEVLGMLLQMLTTVMLLCLDLHHGMLLAFKKSYDVSAVGSLQWNEPLALELLARTGQVFVIALHLAAPVIAVSFVVSLMLALLARAAPQMNVFADGFAVRILAGLAVFGLTLNLLAVHIGTQLGRIPDDLIRLAGLAAGAR